MKAFLTQNNQNGCAPAITTEVSGTLPSPSIVISFVVTTVISMMVMLTPDRCGNGMIILLLWQHLRQLQLWRHLRQLGL